MDKYYNHMNVISHEYENRGNGKRCLVVSIDENNIVEYKKINGTRYEESKFAKYIDFKRAWVNRGLHLPFIGRIYKRKENVKGGRNFPEYVFILQHVISSHEDRYVIMRNLADSNDAEWRQQSAYAFHTVYELHS